MSSLAPNLSTRGQAEPRKRFSLSRTLALVLLTIMALLWIIPLLWAVDTSLKPEAETTTVPVSWLASHFTGDAYHNVFSTADIFRWYFNSAFTALIATVLVIVLASLAAFGLSRIRFRARGPLFWIILAGLMVPGQILIVPLFTEMQQMNLVNTYWGIILPQIASPLAVFIFKQFFDNIPQELEEAAIVDGASRFRVYWQIWMPLARTAISAVAIITFIGVWNNFLWPFIVATGVDMMTLPVGLATVQTSYGVRYAQIMASAVAGGLPVLIVFLFFQRQIIQGVAGTGLKG
ncbi:carbohydrate ABC transporter permease [Ktedonobacter robiniae]|uniref:Sugar ABC transporter permease n=1 Tax=Ktedonobacter robiniae TaxID=2778365 RepID=A0ABQ3V660_9CHLR|nr:carbohydrate ABC transporter permease [Ktedonobacter robiniae]GHO60257.1 sugar ABC transporter permease [Ktedonobacter robiniae]